MLNLMVQSILLETFKNNMLLTMFMFVFLLYGNLFFVSCLINPTDYTRVGWLTRRPIPKAKYMTLGPKFFCCSKMAVTRRRSKLW